MYIYKDFHVWIYVFNLEIYQKAMRCIRSVFKLVQAAMTFRSRVAVDFKPISN